MRILSSIVLLLATLLSSGTPAQKRGAVQSERAFVDTVTNFQIILSGDWQPVSYLDAIGRTRTEFVFHRRNEGLLTIRKEALAGRLLNDKVQSDLDDLRFRDGLVYDNEEPFTGRELSGIRVEFLQFQNVERVKCVYYYLQESDFVWVLRFSGQPDSAGMSMDLTDRIARGFCSVCPIE